MKALKLVLTIAFMMPISLSAAFVLVHNKTKASAVMSLSWVIPGLQDQLIDTTTVASNGQSYFDITWCTSMLEQNNLILEVCQSAKCAKSIISRDNKQLEFEFRDKNSHLELMPM